MAEELLISVAQGDDIYKQLAEKRQLFIIDEIQTSSATELVAHLIYLDKQSDDEITIFINSYGGSIVSGLLPIYDVMKSLRSPIRTICIGEAYSSAALILASGTPGRRFATKHAEMMIHSVQIDNLSGNNDDIQKQTRQIKKLNDSMMGIISAHTKQPLGKIKRDCKNDKYFNTEQAIKYGLIDAELTSINDLPSKSEPKS